MFTTNRTALGVALVAGLAVPACGTAPPDPTEVNGNVAAEEASASLSTEVPDLAPGELGDIPPLASGLALPRLHSFIPQSIEIEQYGVGARVPADANLVTGPDPVDGTASIHAPKGGTPLFVDWSDLGLAVGEHRYVDASLTTGGRHVDRDTFGVDGEACIGARTIAPAYDLSYVAVANNHTYAYVGALRAGAAGDAGVAFLFTQKRPELLTWTPCREAPKTLRFDITEGTTLGDADVLVVGRFVAGADAPMFQAYLAGRPGKHLGPTEALDTTERWIPVNAIVAAAGNVTRTAAGSFGAPGVGTSAAGEPSTLEAGTFVELAVPMKLFAPHAKGHRTHYLTVITLDRAALDGPVPVDLAGPVAVDMAAPKVSFPEPPLPQPILPPEDPAWPLPGVD